jgi:hypothetical protein
MSKNLPDKVQAHMHSDVSRVVKRTRRFGKASPETQLRVLTQLRFNIAGDISPVRFAAVTLLFAFLALSAGSARVVDSQDSFGLQLFIHAVVALVAAVCLLPFLIPQLRSHRRRSVATVWLAAFEGEIVRRQSLSVVDSGSSTTARPWVTRRSRLFPLATLSLSRAHHYCSNERIEVDACRGGAGGDLGQAVIDDVDDRAFVRGVLRELDLLEREPWLYGPQLAGDEGL